MSINVSMSTYNGHFCSPLMSALQAKEIGRGKSFALAVLWPVPIEILILLKQISIHSSKVIIWLVELWIWRLVWFVPRICEGGRNLTPPHQALCDWFYWAGWNFSLGWLSSCHGHTRHSPVLLPALTWQVCVWEGTCCWLTALRAVEEPLG